MSNRTFGFSAHEGQNWFFDIIISLWECVWNDILSIIIPLSDKAVLHYRRTWAKGYQS